MNRLDELISEYKALGIREQIDYNKLYLYSIITHSTAIEGSTVTEVENRLLFDEGISPGKPIEEQLMNLDLKGAYEASFEMVSQNRDITTDDLCFLSSKVLKNTGASYNTISGSFDSSKGELRLLNVSAGYGGRSYMAWQKVPARLAEFCEWLNAGRKSLDRSDIRAVYTFSFEAHYRLVHIHPWADGNGSMSRLLMNMIQYEAGVVPSIVKKEARAEYIQSLSDAREAGDTAVFVSFMLKHHMDNMAEQIKDYKRSIEDDTINDKNETINDTINDTINTVTEITDTAKSILASIAENNSITIDGIAEITGLSRTTVNRAIRLLKDQGFIERIGSRKTGKWIVLKKPG